MFPLFSPSGAFFPRPGSFIFRFSRSSPLACPLPRRGVNWGIKDDVAALITLSLAIEKLFIPLPSRVFQPRYRPRPPKIVFRSATSNLRDRGLITAFPESFRARLVGITSLRLRRGARRRASSREPTGTRETKAEREREEDFFHFLPRAQIEWRKTASSLATVTR